MRVKIFLKFRAVRYVTITLLVLVLFVSNGYSQHGKEMYGYFIYTIAKHVEWPEDEKSEKFTIGIYGNTNIIPQIQILAAKNKIHNKEVEMVKFDEIKDITAVNMLFVPLEYSSQLSEIKDKVKGKSVLIITEKEGIGNQGSSVNFVQRKGKPAFELNKSALEEANLKVSDELLRFAIII